MEERKLKQLKKLQTLQEEPNLAFFDELRELNDKLEPLQSILSEINSKEAKTYEIELETLQEAILSLTESVNNKDMVVNVESNAKELKMINDSLINLLNEAKKEQSVNVKLIIK
jgi:hypothetical protein